MKNFIYENWSTDIFDGFYESMLYNSDSLYYITEDEPKLKEGYIYDINYKEFTNDVAKNAVSLLWNDLNEDIIKSMKFYKLWSPSAYNFATDRLQIKIDLDLNKLKSYCFKTHSFKFNKYLKDNFTSYDGFCSFVSNNISDFKYQYYDDKTRCIAVMIEFYILNNININSYKENLYEYAIECLYGNLAIYKDDDYDTKNPIDYEIVKV